MEEELLWELLYIFRSHSVDGACLQSVIHFPVFNGREVLHNRIERQ